MPEQPDPAEDKPVSPNPPEAADSEPTAEEEIGEFVSRQVLEKDSVFFEG